MSISSDVGLAVLSDNDPVRNALLELGTVAICGNDVVVEGPAVLVDSMPTDVPT